MKKETFEKVLLGVLILGGLIYCYLTFLLKPELNVLKNLQTEIQTKQSHYEQLLANQEDPNGLNEEIQRLKVENTALNTKIPSVLDKPQLMIYLYSAAKAAQVEPMSVSFEQPQNSDNVQSMIMSFTCSGKVTDILAFTKKIESAGNPQIGIQSINLVNQSGKVKADLKLVTYASSTEESTKKPSALQGKNSSTLEQMFQ